MDLSEGHKNQLARYVHFFKGKRERLLTDRNTDKNEFISDRVDSDQVYNGKDVEELIEQYHAQLMGSIRQEMVQIIDFTAVYASQLMATAQQYGMSLEGVDISLVEDQSRVAALHAIDGNISGSLAPLAAQRPQLAAIQPIGGPDLATQQKLQDLQEENRQMLARYQKMQSESATFLQERSTLAAELEKVKSNFDVFRQQVNASGLDSSSSANVNAIEASLFETKTLLDAKQSEVARMNQEMQGRLGDSSQFKELKAIVKKKSDEVKMLRRAMQEAGMAIPAVQGGIELTADDD
jgi:leucine zipper transcription factor-like protein 1